MKTSKPISTISYNTDGFLIQKLEELRKAHIIEYWFFVPHKPEEDEKKEHMHLWIQPARLLQTMDLEDAFREVVPGEEKPRKVRPFKLSKVEDAFLYFLHDEKYLLWKGQSRKYHYSVSDMFSPDPDVLDDIAKDAYRYLAENTGKVDQILEKMQMGLSDQEIVLSMNLPIQFTLQASAFVKTIREAFYQEFSRNGKKGHEEEDDS